LNANAVSVTGQMTRISRSRPGCDRLRVPPRGAALRTVCDCASRTAVRLMLTGASTPPLTPDRPATPSARRGCDARKTNARRWRPPLRHIVGGVGRERLLDNDSVVGVIYPDTLRKFEVRRTLISTTATSRSIACPSLAGPLKAWPARRRRINVHHAPAASGPVTHAPCEYPSHHPSNEMGSRVVRSCSVSATQCSPSHRSVRDCPQRCSDPDATAVELLSERFAEVHGGRLGGAVVDCCGDAGRRRRVGPADAARGEKLRRRPEHRVLVGQARYGTRSRAEPVVRPALDASYPVSSAAPSTTRPPISRDWRHAHQGPLIGGPFHRRGL
jgi:hypothetical protein